MAGEERADRWSRAGRVAADRGTGFEAVFLDPVGQVVQQRWADVALVVAFEDLAPVSAFPVIPGRRWGPGLWWSSTTRRHVSAGSNAMRTQLMVLDRDPRVTDLAGQPVRLLWRNPRGQVRSWGPQLFARYTDGTALLAGCPRHPTPAANAPWARQRPSRKRARTSAGHRPFKPVSHPNAAVAPGSPARAACARQDESFSPEQGRRDNEHLNFSRSLGNRPGRCPHGPRPVPVVLPRTRSPQHRPRRRLDTDCASPRTPLRGPLRRAR
ncbi:TnsA-like heteromeric transposase endonuclease subunit [Streptomyces sp. NPDC001858]